MLEKYLKQFGLSDYESLIYSTLAKNSPCGASLIAQKCNLSRSSVYTTLNSLISKGLVGTTYKNNVKQFIIEDSSSIENLLEKEKEDLNNKFKLLDVIKENLKTLNSDLNLPQIIFFEGQEGLKKIYLSMLRQASSTNSTMLILRDEFVWNNDWGFVFQNEWHNRVKKIKIEKDIKTKLLINNSKIEKEKEEYYKSRNGLDFRFLPKNKNVNNFSLYIVDDIISILSIEKNNLVGIKIVNKNLADNFKNMFDVLWSSSK